MSYSLMPVSPNTKGQPMGAEDVTINAQECDEGCPMCLGAECLLCRPDRCDDGAPQCDHTDEQRHRELSTDEAHHRARVQECLGAYELADYELRSAVQDAARKGMDAIETLGVVFEDDNVRQLFEYEMDGA